MDANPFKVPRRRWFRFSLAGVLAGVTTCAIVLGLGRPWELAPGESLDDLRNKKVKVAEVWVESSMIDWEIPQSERYTAYRGLRDALIDAAKTIEERLEAAQIYYDAMSQFHAKTKVLSNAGAKGGEPHRLLEAQYHMLEAEVWLMVEKAKGSVGELRKEKVRVAEKWVESVQTVMDAEKVPEADRVPTYRALKDARLEAATTERERIIALEDYDEAMKEQYRLIKDANGAGGEAHRLSETRYCILEAQVRLMKEKGNESVDELQKAKVEAAERWVQAASVSFDQGIITQAEQIAALSAWKDARFGAAKNKKERIEVLNDYYEAMKDGYGKTKLLFDVNAKGGEAHRLFEAEYRMLEAQIWLMEEKAKQ
jgi:hypothetical protein